MNAFWNAYVMRLFPGWPDHQTQFQYGFSLFIVFLLTFTAEFCSKNPIVNRKSNRTLAALIGGLLRALKMFMIYLAIIAVVATDFMYFLVAVAGHAVGEFAARVYQDQLEEAKLAIEIEGVQFNKV